MQLYHVIFTEATNATSDLQALNVGEGEDTAKAIALKFITYLLHHVLVKRMIVIS